MPEGTIIAVRMKPAIGKIIFSFWLTGRGGAMRMRRSFFEVSISMIGLWITGTRAM